MSKVAKKPQATHATNVRKLTQLVAALIVDLDRARTEIARLKGEKAPPRYIEQARRMARS
jgi:hypothetical protein